MADGQGVESGSACSSEGAGDSWVNPRHLRPTPDGWQDPAGFHFPAAELGARPEWEPVSELEYRCPAEVSVKFKDLFLDLS